METSTINITKAVLCGDTFIKFTHSGTLSNKKMFRLAFNSSIVKNNKLRFELGQLDPDKIRDDPAFPKRFSVELYFQDMEDPSSDELERQKHDFKQIEECLKYRVSAVRDKDEAAVHKVVFGDEDFDDRDEVMIVDTPIEEGSDESLEEGS